ncbi:hypothetical protein Bca4012_039594 [Brassica carinata]|uniref:Uncharacterized protein n=1 Tax=Brassica carinata TaxID=52824 RepID=A0A8X8B7F6_BRACI|nr:hypothetical protein Bca52824_007833 [Brassica carinata]
MSGESGRSWCIDLLERFIALVARREYGVRSLLEDNEEPLEIALSVIGAGSWSPIDEKYRVSEGVEEFALSRTCERADLTRHTAVRVWSWLFIEAGEWWPRDTSVGGFADGD